MFMEERQKDIVKRVNEKGRIMVSEIQELYHVSADCARRDLRFLERKGHLQRTHGGAISISSAGVYPEKTYNPVDVEGEKRDYMAVAKKALEYLRKNEVIYITTSLAGYYMALHLPEHLQLTVLTNSVTIAEVLRKKECVSVIFLGGTMSPKVCMEAVPRIRGLGETSVLHKRFIERVNTVERGQANKIGFEVDARDFDRWCHNLDAFDVGGIIMEVDTTDFSKVEFSKVVEMGALFMRD